MSTAAALPARVATVIVGAGQSGLAMADALVSRGWHPQQDFIVLDRGTEERLAWRRRWNSLTLFTPAWYSRLPGARLPGSQRRYPTTAELADYLDAYRRRLRLEVLWGTEVTDVRVEGDQLVLSTSKGEMRAGNVIAASGPFADPARPAFADDLNLPGVNLHSDDYREPSQIPAGPVLVVGAGNTGVQIARELASTHKVHLAVGAPQRVLPIRIAGVSLFRWLALTGLLKASPESSRGRRMAAVEPIIGPGVDELATRGVVLHPRLVAADGRSLTFADGYELRPTSIVWATGYRSGFAWLDRTVDIARLPGSRGKTPVRGLHVLGAPWLSSRGSALIGGVGRDADRIATQIVGSR